MFRNFFARVDGERKDIMRGGALSCAFYASSLLAFLGLISRMHGTVAGTIHDLEKNGWKRARVPRAGDVLVWESERDERGEMHRHIGFALGGAKAISNVSGSGVVGTHHVTFGMRRGKPRRRITAIYRKTL